MDMWSPQRRIAYLCGIEGQEEGYPLSNIFCVITLQRAVCGGWLII